MSNRKMIRAAALLALAAVVAPLAACGDSGESPRNVTETSEAVVTEAETLSVEDERSAVSDDLPEMDFNGYRYRLVWYGNEFAYHPEEESGDVVEDSVYSRNRTVEERFNIEIADMCYGDSYAAHSTAIKNAVLAGDEAFDVSFDHIIAGPNNSLEGLYLNFYDIPYIDFDKPWWQANAVAEMTVLGQMYCATCDYVYDSTAGCKIIYANIDRLKDYGMEVPYDDVLGHTWTFDKLISITRDVYEDVNGNGEDDDEDFYGYISHAEQNGFLASFEIPILTKSDEKGIEITVNSEKTVDFFNKLTSWYYEDRGTHIVHGNDPVTNLSQSDWQIRLFSEGRSLFCFGRPNDAAKKLRESDINYGFLPFPLWDEAQEEYKTFTSGNLLCIPVICSDTERAGVIFQAMAAEGYKQIIPAYFETALKEKFTFDNESVQMLDLINSTRCISFAYAYDNWEGFGHMTYKVTVEFKNNFASFYASRLSSATNRINKIADFFESHAG